MTLKLLYAPVVIYAKALVLVGLLACSITISIAIAASTTDSEVEVRQVIEQMNRFVTDRKLPELLKLFAEDSIKVDLFPMRSYGKKEAKGNNKVKTTTLEQRWQAVAPILFSSTKFYRRSVKNMELHIDKGLAVAWLDIETETVSRKQDATRKFNRFKEICILRRYQDGWKIVVLSNNRHDI